MVYLEDFKIFFGGFYGSFFKLILGCICLVVLRYGGWLYFRCC